MNHKTATTASAPSIGTPPALRNHDPLLSHHTLIAVAFVALFLRPSSATEPDVHFSRDIRPILSNHCFKCHGTDEATREADLRLDTQEAAHADRDGARPIDPKNPSESLVLQRILSEDDDLRMPPPDAGLDLSENQLALLKTWIESGGQYDQHWAFQPVLNPPLPATASGNSPIDAFIAERLVPLGLRSAPQADKNTLLRRVHLDFLGLPPGPADLTRFLGDAAPDAYERMLDRVLASPRFGERWGRHWLDQARYADTNGYTVDSERSIWPYRDWVIHAINADLPFDQFTVEQLAGDLLPHPTQEQQIATGFHRNTLVNEEGGSDPEQFRNEAVVDRVNTSGAVWLGLTLACAQCHSHKYDPLTQREYYEIFAFFNQAQDKNAIQPTIPVQTESDRKHLAQLNQQIADATQALADYDRTKNEQRSPSERDDGKPIVWTALDIESVMSAAGAEFQRLDDNSWLVTGNNADEDCYTVTFRTPLPHITAIQLETLTHPSLPKNGPGRVENGNFVLNDIRLRAMADPVPWLHASADHSQKDYSVLGAIDSDPMSGWAINVESGSLNVNRTARFITPQTLAQDHVFTLTLTFGPKPPRYNIGRFRLSATDAPHAKLDLPDPERQSLVDQKQKHEDARAAYIKKLPTTMVMSDRNEPRPTHLLVRGDFLRPGDPVQPSTPAFLPPLEMQKPDRQPNRLDFARWLVQRDHPLTSRVTANRVWMRLFGQGLVETENDFGFQGTPPTHPHLLDWLASDFIDAGWSFKHLLRTIAASQTYRQSCVQRPEAVQPDPTNKLLARQVRLRVEAEVIRDLVLAASGLLDARLGGPSVYPPQPDGVFAFTQRDVKWPTSTGSDRYRRGLYTFFMRSAPNPMLTTFDSPAFHTTCTRRVRSNTPLQALTLANDLVILEAARAFADRVLASATEDRQRIDAAYRYALARTPTPTERDRLNDYLNQERQLLAASPSDTLAILALEPNQSSTGDAEQIDRAVWTLAARVLFNLDEFVTRE